MTRLMYAQLETSDLPVGEYQPSISLLLAPKIPVLKPSHDKPYATVRSSDGGEHWQVRDSGGINILVHSWRN